MGYLLKKKFGFALNLQDHGNFFESKYWKRESLLNSLRYQVGKFLLRRADSIRVVSNLEREYLEKIGLKNVVKVPVYVDTKEKHLQRSRGERFMILALSRFVKQKNIPLLLEAFESLSKTFADLRLTIVGRGVEEKALKEFVRKHGLSEMVTFKPWADDVEAEYSQADLFVLSSNYEGWGMTVVEAASHGVPIVMTKT